MDDFERAVRTRPGEAWRVLCDILEEHGRGAPRSADGLPTTVCPGCGKRIGFAEESAADGKLKRHPLDLTGPVYEVAFEPAGALLRVRRARQSFVTHFATCPVAASFTKHRGGAKR